MIFRYRQWEPDELSQQQRMNQLARMLTYLLLQANGDVNQALEWARYLARQTGLLDAAQSWQDFVDGLKERGMIRESAADDGSGEGGEGNDTVTYALTKRGERIIREDSLNAIFSSLKKSLNGMHPVPREGEGVERVSETRQYKFGDPSSNIDFPTTVGNAIRREGLDFVLREEDLEVYETEHLTSCATVLLLDISHSMVLYGEDRITPAKQVALALSELVMRKYPRDYYKVVLFGDDAYEVEVDQLPYVSVGPYHTNTKAALQAAQSLLNHQHCANKQIFMITDGKPSAIAENGRLYVNSIGLDPKIVSRTIEEAARCRRQKITITTFMVTQDPYLVKFVRRLTEVNQGRAYYSAADDLGGYVLEDFVRNRRRRVN